MHLVYCWLPALTNITPDNFLFSYLIKLKFLCEKPLKSYVHALIDTIFVNVFSLRRQINIINCYLVLQP
jgi:hypothetical protein